MATKRDEPFEELYATLEETVAKLERGGLSLEESIALYEQGMDLAKRCQALLDRAELRITRLSESFAQPAAPEVPSAVDGAPDEEEQEVFPLEEE